MNQIKFLGWLTAIVVLLYVGTAVVASVRTGISWQDFSGTVGPIAGMLLGYWVRGEK